MYTVHTHVSIRERVVKECEITHGGTVVRRKYKTYLYLELSCLERSKSKYLFIFIYIYLYIIALYLTSLAIVWSVHPRPDPRLT